MGSQTNRVNRLGAGGFEPCLDRKVLTHPFRRFAVVPFGRFAVVLGVGMGLLRTGGRTGSQGLFGSGAYLARALTLPALSFGSLAYRALTHALPARDLSN